VDPTTARLRVFLLLLFTVVVLGTVGFTVLEGLSPADSLYLTIVTVATVGYGDMYPVTPEGKVLALILILGGAGAFLGVFTGVAEATFSRREKRRRLQNLHLVIGVFFSELGTALLRRFAAADPKAHEAGEVLAGMDHWDRRQFAAAEQDVRSRKYRVDPDMVDLTELYAVLLEKRPLLVRILENPTLQEHETFTDLLRATFHLTEELAVREDLESLPATDRTHLVGDATRVYGLLVPAWFGYVTFLKDDYPYLFSLAARMNPFDPGSSVVVDT
jgi:voltage-gated potassium channel